MGEYNRHMCSVDLLDCIMGHYKIKLRSKFVTLDYCTIFWTWVCAMRCFCIEESKKKRDQLTKLWTQLTLGKRYQRHCVNLESSSQLANGNQIWKMNSKEKNGILHNTFHHMMWEETNVVIGLNELIRE